MRAVDTNVLARHYLRRCGAGAYREEHSFGRLELKRTTGELREARQTLCGFPNQRGGVVVFDQSRAC